MSDFYSAFEARFRGSRELIAARLRGYEPFLLPLAALYPGGSAVDLGCGRGEWLELLGQAGFKATGVDLDDSMLAACRERQLDVIHADAVEHLQRLPDASQALVSAFHVVEHIPFESLRTLVREAHRVLQPGGLLILETPNIENLVVGSSSFYLDPTHLRPVHPLLLTFVVEEGGFARTKLLRLNGDPLPTSADIGLGHVFGGVSPDCSVVGQKAAHAASDPAFAPAFEADWGVSLAQACGAYDGAIRAQWRAQWRAQEQAQERAQELTKELLASSVQSLQTRLDRQATDLQRARDELARFRGEVNQMRNEVRSELQNEVAALHQALHAIHTSRSWRWTAPVRRVHAGVRRVAGKVLRRTLPMARTVVHQTSWTKKIVRGALESSPSTARFVRRFLGIPETPVSPSPAAPPPPPIRLFQDLRSVKLMSAIAQSEHADAPVVFITKDGHVD
ncbi:methyltransferase domain-containing protein [Ramlibacter sp. MMS24-I3-19]|uniref:methyltransferase domain-containing protein n=1 Tax=Ramlibacter sp. MMS24-I3-19 TaxID=3416606 RepID=UPI003CFDE1C0